jgi:hypothetical protein
MLKIANKYIEWPKETGMDNRDKPFVIAIIGENPFGKFLEQVTKIKNKIVIIRIINRVEQIPGCHLLFVSDLPGRLFSKLESIQDKPILTVTDTEDYAELGIHINLLVGKTSNPRLVINETAARQSGLEMKKDLLNLADDIVQPYRPYEDKANKLKPITRFVTWPPRSGMNDTSKLFKIAVIGENFFDNHLDKTYKKKTLKNKRVTIRYISKIQEINDAHLLFISKSMKQNISDIISYTKNKPILTIGDTKGFHQAGVHINFFYDRLRLSFEINEEAALSAGFNISYHLLKWAKTDTSH